MSRLKVPRTPSIRRMPIYLFKLFAMQAEGKTYVSCTELAQYINLELIVVRKDIALTGLAGHRRYGYVITELIDAIKRLIGWSTRMTATIIGAGSLASALMGKTRDFNMSGLTIVSVFDSSPDKIGKVIHGHLIRDIKDFPAYNRENPARLGILCVPEDNAQEAANLLINNGILYLWSFALTCLQVPKNIIVQREVLASGLSELAAKIKQANGGIIPPID